MSLTSPEAQLVQAAITAVQVHVGYAAVLPETGELELPVEADFQQPFAAADHQAWSREYQQRFTAERPCFQ